MVPMRFGLACKGCGKQIPFQLKAGRCECGDTYLVEYDLEQVGRTFTKESLSHRESSMWRYAELLPVGNKESVISLGEGWTPLLRLPHAERTLPLKRLWVKREEQNPT